MELKYKDSKNISPLSSTDSDQEVNSILPFYLHVFSLIPRTNLCNLPKSQS